MEIVKLKMQILNAQSERREQMQVLNAGRG